MAASDTLAERYGRARTGTRRDRVVAIVLAALAAVVFVVWLVWSGLGSTEQSVSSQDIGYNIVSPHAVDVSFTVSADPGHAVSCAVQSLNESFAVIGWKIVSYPASSKRTNAHVERVRTIEPANTALIYSCWLT